MSTVFRTYYVHGGSDEVSDLWPPDAEQQDVFEYALYELAIHLEIDLDTGHSRIVGVDDQPHEGKWSQ